MSRHSKNDKIESIGFVDDNTALARVPCSIGPRPFVNFLSLVRIDGQCLIVAKVLYFVEDSG